MRESRLHGSVRGAVSNHRPYRESSTDPNWAEKNGPLVATPTRKSFGTRMIGLLGQQLNGKVNFAYEPAGFAYSLDVPLSSMTANS